jgi:hypothetical protein
MYTLSMSDTCSENKPGKRQVRALISRDPKHYRAGDPRAARAFAAEIFKSLGLSPANTSAAETTQRAWTLLSQPTTK